MIQKSKLYTTKEVLSLLEISQSTLISYRRKGQIIGAKIGREYKYLGEEILKFIKGKQEQSHGHNRK